MNDPKLFKESRDKLCANLKTIPEKYFYLLDQKGYNESTVLDIGSGPGDLTHDIFHLFEIPISKVVGFDVSKTMVDFANATYGNSIVSFELFDIAKYVPEMYMSYFDYVFSFWSLHWIRDHGTLFSNIHKVMKHNGQMIVSFIAQSKLFEIYQKVWHKPEYTPYIKDFDAAQSCFQKSKNPKKELQDVLEECGFEVSMMKIETVKSHTVKAADFKEFLASINPHYHQIPHHLKDKFIDDHVEEFGKDYYLEHDLFVVYAKKTNIVTLNLINNPEKYFDLLDQRDNKESTVLDIGSGPGDITQDLLQRFTIPITKAVATDVSKTMVDFANNHYGNSILSFELFDIGKEVPEKYLSYFDYVLSFWALHWIQDQRALFSNIHKVMRPKAQMLVSFIAQSNLFEIYQKVWHKPEYAAYIKDFDASQSCFQNSKNPKKELQDILEKCGFEVSMIKIETAKTHTLSTIDAKDFLVSIIPDYQQIPKHLKDKFIDDHLEEFKQGYSIEHDIFIVYAKKN